MQTVFGIPASVSPAPGPDRAAWRHDLHVTVHITHARDPCRCSAIGLMGVFVDGFAPQVDHAMLCHDIEAAAQWQAEPAHRYGDQPAQSLVVDRWQLEPEPPPFSPRRAGATAVP